MKNERRLLCLITLLLPLSTITMEHSSLLLQESDTVGTLPVVHYKNTIVTVINESFHSFFCEIMCSTCASPHQYTSIACIDRRDIAPHSQIDFYAYTGDCIGLIDHDPYGERGTVKTTRVSQKNLVIRIASTKDNGWTLIKGESKTSSKKTNRTTATWRLKTILGNKKKRKDNILPQSYDHSPMN